MSESLSPTLSVGVIVKAQGLRGEVKIRPLTDSPEQWLTIGRVSYTVQGQRVEKRLRNTRIAGEMVFTQLEGVYDRNAAEALRGITLELLREDAPVPEENSWYIVDLIGCTLTDEDGAPLGTIIDVMQPGGNDVYEVKTPTGKFLMPALRHVICKADMPGRTVSVYRERLEEVRVDED